MSGRRAANREMRAAGERVLADYPLYTSIDGTAEATTLHERIDPAGLPAELVDAVEAGEPAADADTARLNDLIASLDS